MTASEPMRPETKRLLWDLGYDIVVKERSGLKPYFVVRAPGGGLMELSDGPSFYRVEDKAWADALRHAESWDGLRANFPEVVRLLREHGLLVFGDTVSVARDAPSLKFVRATDSPEADAFALLRKVTGA